MDNLFKLGMYNPTGLAVNHQHRINFGALQALVQYALAHHAGGSGNNSSYSF